MDTISPKDHGEAVALFRSEIIGALCRRDLDRGELRAALVLSLTLIHRGFLDRIHGKGVVVSRNAGVVIG